MLVPEPFRRYPALSTTGKLLVGKVKKRQGPAAAADISVGAVYVRPLQLPVHTIDVQAAAQTRLRRHE